MTKVLITGGAGFIGSHLCDRLVARGDTVVVIDDFSSSSPENLAHLEGKIEVVRDSVHNLARHEEKLEGVTLVYHLAALISGFDSLSKPTEYLDQNLGGLLKVIELAKVLKRPRLIFASSSTVYGRRETPTCREQDQAAPATIYALTKLAGEQLLSMYAPLNHYEHVSLRLFNVYGPRQNPHHPYANVTCKFARAAALDEAVKLYGNGEQTRDFVYVSDVVEAFLAAAAPTPQRVYNVGTGTDRSINSLLTELHGISGKPLRTEQGGEWPNDIRAIRADISRIREDLGFKPAVPLRDGLERTYAFFRRGTRNGP
jgi:UDP-glucose 4-epimerase